MGDIQSRDNELKSKAYEAINKHQAVVRQDPNRLHYHIMPPVGLLNDPNGFVFYKGKYHVFYQWNPFATQHGAKFWGHLSSKDLVNWDEEPIALAPSSWFDQNGCYSGSAIVYQEQLYLFYTGNVRDEAGNRETYQCLAISTDGVNFEKKGPVIHLPSGYTAHFRDPKVWKKDNQWYMVIGAQTEEEKGTVVLYQSDDLWNWKFIGPITEQQDFGYMWECPDLFSIDGKDVLLISPQGIESEGYKYQNIYQSGYFVGQLSYTKAKFSHDKFIELDRGFDFYAPQTTEDDSGRRLLFGWMGVPEENEQDHPTIANEWIHAMTLPRQLVLKENKLYQQPVEELTKLRKKHVIFSNVTIENKKLHLPEVDGNVCELIVDIKKRLGEVFFVSFGDHTRIVYDQKQSRFSLERKNMKNDEIESRHCSLHELRCIRIFIDTSAIEIFINDGEEVFSARIFDTQENNRIAFHSNGKAIIDIDKWELDQVFL